MLYSEGFGAVELEVYVTLDTETDSEGWMELCETAFD